MATRLYFPSTGTAPLTPAIDSVWDAYGEMSRRPMNKDRGTSASAVGTQVSWTAASAAALDRQYIGPAMAAGNVFASATLIGQLMVREYNNGDNSQYLYCGIRICNSTGTIRTTLVTTATHTTLAEFINNVSHRNARIFDGDAIPSSATYSTANGDRLVVEIGYGDNGGATPEASGKWGEDGSDLPLNNTQTTYGNPWLQFSNNIVWQAESSFTSLAQTAVIKQETFTTLAQSGGFKESAFAVLAQAASIVSASFASFTVLAQSAAFVEAAFATLAQGGSVKESAFAALAQSGAIKEGAFASLAQGGAFVESSTVTVATSGGFVESGFATLAQSAQFAGADVGGGTPWWKRVHRTIISPLYNRLTGFVRGTGT